MRRNLLLAALIMGLFALFFFTCTTPLTPTSKTRPYAFSHQGPLATSTPQDTSTLSSIDTIHTGDSLMLIGFMLPVDSRVKGQFWAFDDGATDTQATVKHSFGQSGVHYAIFSIFDNVGDTMSDTVVVCVNTPPDSVLLLSPIEGCNDELFTPTLTWKGFDSDRFDSTLLYSVILNRGSDVIDTAIKWNELTSITLDKNFKRGENISWRVLAKDKFGDITASKTGHFLVQPSTDATLAKLSLSVGNMKPAFSPDDSAYTATVPKETTSVALICSTNVKRTTITVNATTIPSGQSVIKLNLPDTINVFAIKIVAPDKIAKKSYYLTVIRRQSVNALLSSLHVSAGEISRGFHDTIFSYLDTVPWDTSSVTTTPKAQDSMARISVSGTSITSIDTSVSIPLEVGTNQIPVIVTASDGETKKTYQITMIRKPPMDVALASLLFSAGTLRNISAPMPDTLRDTLSFLDSAVTVTPTADTLMTIKVDTTVVRSGNASRLICLSVGTTKITITASHGTTMKKYTLLFVRKSDGTFIPVVAPTGFAAGGISVSSVRILWSDVVQATFYRVQRSRLPSSDFATVGLPTSNAYIDTGLDSGSIYYYRVCASNSKGDGDFSMTDSAVTFYRPKITNQPQSQSAYLGTRAIFSVTASGIPAPTFQWQKNNTNIGGATSASCTTSTLAPIDNGTRYRCISRNGGGADTSTEAVLTVNDTLVTKPIVLNMPQEDVVAKIGESIALIISTTDAITSIQWYKDGVALPQSQSCTLSINDIKISDAGMYSVKVKKGTDSASSEPFRIRVLPALTTGLSVTPRSALSVGVTWDQTAGASWYRVLRASGSTAFASICSTTQANFVDTPLTQGTSYSYKIYAGNSDGIGDTTTSLVAQTFYCPQISVQPLPQTILEGQTVDLSVTATGLPSCSYQWEKNNLPVVGATSARYQHANATVEDSGDYRVIVYNSAGSLPSNFVHVSVIPAYTLSPNAVPAAGGVIARSKPGTSILQGDSIRLTAHANPGYRFTGWSGDTTGSDTSILIIFRKNRTINAQFLKQSTLSVSIGLGQGTMTLIGDSTCDSGTTVQVTATSSTGYRFLGWFGDTNATTATLRIPLLQNRTITAKFIRQCKLSVSTNAIQGTTSLLGDSTCDSGTTVLVTATPNPGYRFGSWVGNDTTGINSPISIPLLRNRTINAQFVRQYKLLVSIGLGMGTITPARDSSYDSATVISMTATPGNGYRFYSWSGDTLTTNRALNITLLRDRTISVRFMRRCTLSISVGLGQGITTLTRDSTCDSGTTIPVTATPSTGYKFSSWSGDTASTGNPITVRMRANRTLRVNFWKQYNLSLSSLSQGSIIPSGTIVVDSAAPTPINATPNTGYAFKLWMIRSGVPVFADSSAASTTVKLSQGDASVVASYKILTFKKFIGDIGSEKGSCAWQTRDGGYIISGTTNSIGTGGNDVFLVRTDSKGEVIWKQPFGTAGSDQGFCVQETNDNGFIVIGSTMTTVGTDDLWLIKTDRNGVQLWTKTYGNTSNDVGRFVQATGDTGFIIAGTTIPAGSISSKVYVIRTDALGNRPVTSDEYFERTFGNNLNDSGYCAQMTADTGFIIVGKTAMSSTNDDVYLIKLNKYGNPRWSKTIGGPNNDFGYCVRQTTDNGFIICGKTASFGAGGDDVYLNKTDNSGATTWYKTFGGTSNDQGNSVQQTSDGGYIIVGTTMSFGVGGDIYIIKTDAAGNTMWTKNYGDNGADAGNSVQQTPDGGFIIVGTYRNVRGDDDIFLLKLNENGNIE
jgi:hypothetical protein